MAFSGALYHSAAAAIIHNAPVELDAAIIHCCQLTFVCRPISSIVHFPNPPQRPQKNFVISDTIIDLFTYLLTYLLTYGGCSYLYTYMEKLMMVISKRHRTPATISAVVSTAQCTQHSSDCINVYLTRQLRRNLKADEMIHPLVHCAVQLSTVVPFRVYDLISYKHCTHGT